MGYTVLADTDSRSTNQIDTDTFPAIEAYISEQKGRKDEDRYIHVSEREGRTAIFGIKQGIIKHIHDVRALDCDTTFMPVLGETNLYEIKGWMAGINKGISCFQPSLSELLFSYVPEVTLGRVWMKLHDRRAFQFVWEELLSLVKHLTNKTLGFVSLHRGGTLLGVNADMEAAPLLGMADALLSTIDLPSVAEKVKDAARVLKRNVHICYSHVKRFVLSMEFWPP